MPDLVIVQFGFVKNKRKSNHNMLLRSANGLINPKIRKFSQNTTQFKLSIKSPRETNDVRLLLKQLKIIV